MSKARNNAINMARGDLIITIDGDIIPTTSFIEDHILSHRNNDNILLYSDRKFKDIDELNILNVENILKETINEKNKTLEEKEKKFKETIPDIWQRVWSFNMSFKKKNYTLFNENFTGYGLEDAEFAYNLFINHNYIIEKSDMSVFHINEKLEKLYNPYCVKNKENISKFLKNAIFFIDKYKTNANVFIKSFYMPDINNINGGSINFYNKYLKNNNISEDKLFLESITCLQNIIQNID